MKAINKAKLDRRPGQEEVKVGWVSPRSIRCKVPVCVCRCRIATNSGRELIKV